jgi:hypothetical protein
MSAAAAALCARSTYTSRRLLRKTCTPVIDKNSQGAPGRGDHHRGGGEEHLGEELPVGEDHLVICIDLVMQKIL